MGVSWPSPLETGKRTTKNTALAERLGLPRTGLYRVLERLEVWGFVTSMKAGGQPTQFQVRPLEVALEQYFAFQRRAVLPLLGIGNTSHGLHEVSTDQSSSDLSNRAQPGQMRLLTGREEIFATYVELAGRARQDLLTINIGEMVPEAIYELAQAASERGVSQRLLFQRHTPENDHWIKRWRAYGCQVRLVDGTGYHLNIIDHHYAILSSGNPNNTDERTAVLIDAPAIVDELRAYFFGQWRVSRKLGKLDG